jgi:hypothetical protein
MSTENYQEIAKRIEKINKKCEVFSNPVRTLIISIITAKGEANWTDLKETIEKINGAAMNPNTLSFHIGKLVEMEYIKKSGTKEQPSYKISNIHSEELGSYIDLFIVDSLKKAFL